MQRQNRPLNRRRILVRRTVVAGVLVSIAILLSFMVPRWLAGDETYVPGGDVEGITNSLEREGPDGGVPFRFTEIAAEAGIEFEHLTFRRSTQLPEDMGSGVAWGEKRSSWETI